MSRLPSRFASLPALLLPVLAFAGPYPNTGFMGDMADPGAAWYQRCEAVEHAKPSAAALRAGSSAKNCDSTAMYYDTRALAAPSAGDWERVRACAVASKDERVLMMLFANGYGVKQDLDVATRYACSLDMVAPAEMESRIKHLLGLNKSARPFDFCDDITSGASGALCASMQEGQRGRARAAQLNRYASSLAPAVQSEFERLRKAQAAFAKSSEDNENDMHGTAAVGLSIEARGKIDAEFVDDLLALADGRMPKYSPAELDQVVAKLQSTYQQIMETPSTQDGSPERVGSSTMTRDGVRDTQSAWLSFREAWAEFIVASEAPLDSVSVKVVLTHRRIEQLARILSYAR